MINSLYRRNSLHLGRVKKIGKYIIIFNWFGFLFKVVTKGLFTSSETFMVFAYLDFGNLQLKP